MPITYQIDRTRRLIRTKCAGNVTLNEVIGHFRTLERDPECPDRLNVLLDLSEMTSLPESEEMRAASYQVASVRKTVQFESCAVVAVSDALFGMSRMFAVFAESWFREILVFRARDEAEAWLAGQEGLINPQSV